MLNNLSSQEKTGSRMDTIVSNVRIDERTPRSVKIFWEIDDLEQHLEQSEILLSDAFSFEGQRWRLLLLTDPTPLNASLSRVDSSDEPPRLSLVWWHAGVVDIDGSWHYNRMGYIKLDSSSEDWKTVAEWDTPKWSELFTKKDEFLPDGQMTLAFQLCLDTAPDGTSLVESSPQRHTVPCEVTVTVRDETFLVQKSILEALSPVLAVMLYSSGTDGENLGVHLEDCNPKIFEIVLSFLYTGSLDDLDTETLIEVYHVACEYIVAGLKETCVQRMLERLTTTSVCRVLALAERHGDVELGETAIKFFLAHTTDVFNTSAWSWLEITDKKLADELVTLSREMKLNW